MLGLKDNTGNGGNCMPEQKNDHKEFNLKEWICQQLNIQQDAKKKKKGKLPKRTHFTIWYVIIVFFVLSLIQQLFFSSNVEDIKYGAFKR
jgi:hypothetical protein